eukprot:1159415-Pelagomonas_calceolata.AAC.5
MLCGDFNAKVGGLLEVSDTHCKAFVDCPALQMARRCECNEVNMAGNLLVDIAAAYGLVFTTGRVQGDDGQPTFFGLSVNLLMWNLEMPVQLEAALEAGNVDTACFCLRSWIMQAASGHHVGMCKVQDCIFKRTEKRGIRRPVKSGQAVHAC